MKTKLVAVQCVKYVGVQPEVLARYKGKRHSFELVSEDGTVWTIKRFNSRKKCERRAAAFARFCGLPLQALKG